MVCGLWFVVWILGIRVWVMGIGFGIGGFEFEGFGFGGLPHCVHREAAETMTV